MINTWFLAAVCLGVLCLCAVLRVIPGPTPYDRLVAGSAAVTLGSAAALALSIAGGDLGILDLAIVIALICFAGMFLIAKMQGGEPA